MLSTTSIVTIDTSDHGYSVDVNTGAGKIYVTGKTSIYEPSESGVFVAELDAGGIVVWYRVIRGETNESRGSM